MAEEGVPGGGLTGTEAAARLARYRPNEIGVERRHRARALAGKLSGPVPWMLEAAIVLEIAAGKAGPICA
jgi:H+-transporting ATPase